MSFSIPDRWAALAAQYPEQTVGRVTLQEKGMYRIRTAMGEQNALVSGKFQYDAQSASDYPAVGDYVTAGCAGGDTAIIHQVLPRQERRICLHHGPGHEAGLPRSFTAGIAAVLDAGTAGLYA